MRARFGLVKGLCISIASIVVGTPAMAQCVLPADMNGVFVGNDGGTYYVRQVGTEIWWLGESSDGGKRFVNVFHGVRNGQVVKGTWADVSGQFRNSGMLQLVVSSGSGVSGWKRSAETGGFTGSSWTFPCGDTNANPKP